MAKFSTIKRFRANPVEYAIFATITLIFAHAVFTLLNDSSGFQFNAITPMAANPVTETRSIASTIPTVLNLDMICDSTPTQSTSASKMRIAGPLCGLPDKDSLTKAAVTVTHESNRFAATVFADPEAGNFSTDYIPLSSGENTIRVELTYKGGKNFAQTIVLNHD